MEFFLTETNLSGRLTVVWNCKGTKQPIQFILKKFKTHKNVHFLHHRMHCVCLLINKMALVLINVSFVFSMCKCVKPFSWKASLHCAAMRDSLRYLLLLKRSVILTASLGWHEGRDLGVPWDDYCVVPPPECVWWMQLWPWRVEESTVALQRETKMCSRAQSYISTSVGLSLFLHGLALRY